MNLMQINYFVEVAKTLSFTEAAKKLYISQPALSKQIAILEKELGIQLFKRNHRLIKLTESGEMLLVDCENIQMQIANMIMKVQNDAVNHTTTIYIGVLKGINLEFFIEVVKQFINKNPKCNVSIKNYNFKELREELENGSIDLIFTLSFELKSITNVLSKFIKYRSEYFIIANDHPLATKEKLTFEDLVDVPFIVIDENNSYAGTEIMKNKWKQFKYIPKKVLKAPNVETILSYIQLGMGVTILDKSIIDKVYTNIKCYEVPNGKNTYGVVASWKKDNRNSALPLLLSEIHEVRD